MSLTTIPNIEALLATWLGDHAEIVALDARVAGTLPKTESMTRPWVRVTLLDPQDSSRSSIEYLMNYMVQLDCYAGATAMRTHVGQQEAWDLVSTVRAILKDRRGMAGNGVVVTDVRFPGMSRIPDTDFDPARERYILTAEIMVHPT